MNLDTSDKQLCHRNESQNIRGEHFFDFLFVNVTNMLQSLDESSIVDWRTRLIFNIMAPILWMRTKNVNVAELLRDFCP